MTLRSTVLFAILGMVSGVASALGQDAPPRYKLMVGQEIQYQTVSDSKFPEVTSHDQVTRTLWVIARNPDGSFRVVEHDLTESSETPRDGKSTTSQTERVSCFDVFPDGRVVPDDSMADARPSLFVFPRLPRDAADKTWQCDYSDDGRTEFTALSGQTTAKDFVFHFEEHTLQDEIFLETDAGTVHFDPERGLLVAETSQSSMDYGFHVKTNSSSSLKSVEMKDQAFTEQLADESHAYFKAVDDYGQAERNASENGARGDAIMKQAGDTLREARSRLTLPMFTKPLDEMLARHDHIVSYFHEEAQHVGGLVDKPATDWTLKDLSGKSHSLADYRGKVVVLDFWYRGCGWCIKAMPEMKKIAGDFKNDPVVVIGMNTDRNEQDAQFVADKMGLNYRTLRDTARPEMYGVRAFPTVILIDAQGTVRAVISGYSPHMRDELDDEIRKLLPK